jgi:hypothetical protein
MSRRNAMPWAAPDVASHLAAADVRAYIADANKPPDETVGDAAEGLVRRARDELEMKLVACFSDCAEQATSDAATPERAPLGPPDRRSFDLGVR